MHKIKIAPKKYINIFIIYTVIIMFIFSTLKTTKRVADLINPLDRKPSENVTFLYLDSINVKTDSNNIYIGSTKDYIFIRNFKDSTNRLYNVKDVKKLEIKKNNH